MAFFSSTALAPESALFRGRQAELARLMQLCQGDVSAYTVVYGGRQNGKTSLLLRLGARLTATVSVCRVDFQLIKGASVERAFAFLAGQIAQTLPLAPDASRVSDGPALLVFLSQALARSEIARLVVLLDELGALPALTREALANALRSLFHERLDRPALSKLQVVFSGGIELYDLVVTEVSSLHNICEEIYLLDLDRSEAETLIADGLRGLGLADATAVALGAAVYERAAGHPYLTQRIGGLLEQAHQAGTPLNPTAVDAATRRIRQGDTLLRRIRDDLREQHLQDAARRLLSDPPRFTRLDDDMARLELIGLAKPAGERWAPRNPLLAEVFGEMLGLPATPVAPVTPVAPPAPTTRTPPDPDAQAVITAKKRRLSTLEVQAARYGIDCPAHITIEIEDLRREIAEAEGEANVQQNAAPPTPAQDLSGGANTRVEPQERTPVAPPDRSPDTPAPPQTASKNASLITNPASLPSWLPELIRIPAGPFLMGSSDADTRADDDEKPQHRLKLPDYWIGKTPVTNAQFRPFVEGDGYTNRAYWTAVGWAWRKEENILKPVDWDDAKWNGADYPVVGVSWFEALAYCRWLSAQTGDDYRLPSEAEWEKAARGPAGLIWPWGNTWEAGRCNSKEAGIQRTTPVGQYPTGASPYGVLDMAGNVWEWCATKYGRSYPYQPEDEWTEAYLEEDVGRRIRGGAWFQDQRFVRGAYRHYIDPRNRYYINGLRVASHSLRTDSES
jgi:formylglycine-generating enzyme required for sulfatase activity